MALPNGRGSEGHGSRKKPFNSANGAQLSNSAKLPSSAMALAARMNPPHAARAIELPTLILRTPSSARSETFSPVFALISTFTGLGLTAEMMA